MSLPFIMTKDQDLNLLQTRYRSLINPVLDNPLLKGNLIDGVVLTIGSTNVLNHKLSRNQLGYIITDQNATARIYRAAPLNEKTLTLASDAAVTISLLVF